MLCVNKIYRFTSSHIPDDFKLYTVPKMYVLKQKYYTIIAYPNGKCRIMGKEANIDNVKKHFPEVDNIQIQSRTYVYNLGRTVDISKIKDGCYEPELFAARTIRKFNVMINIFHTGKVIMMGRNCKKSLIINSILPYLESLLL